MDNKTESNSLELAKQFIKIFEGLSLKKYRCSANKETIGYGHVILPHDNIKGDFITNERAEELLHDDCNIASKSLISKLQEYSSLNIQQRASLISFIFNIGVRAFETSTMKKYLEAKNYTKAASEFDRWVHAGSKRLQGLVARRAREKMLFLMSNDSVNITNINYKKIANEVFNRKL